MDPWSVLTAVVAFSAVFLAGYIVLQDQEAMSEKEGEGASADDAGGWDGKDAWDAYNALLNLRNAELAALWARFNVHLVINAGLLFGALTGGVARQLGQKPFGLGLLLTVLWCCSEIVGRKTLHGRDGELAKFASKAWSPQHLYRRVTERGQAPNQGALSFQGLRRWQMAVSFLVIATFAAIWCYLLFAGFPKNASGI